MVFFAQTKLKRAIKTGDTAKIESLLAAGLDVNQRLGHGKLYGQATPLHIAVKEKREDVAAFLLGKGAKPDIVDGYAWTPLHHAAHDGHLGLVQLLLKAGADPNLRTEEGRTAYGWATVRQMPEVAEAIAPYMKKAEINRAETDAPANRDGWRALSESQVAHVESHKALGYRVTDIFNFRARERIRIVHNLETRADQAASLSFDDVADKASLEEARAELLRLGGSAPAEIPAEGLRKSAVLVKPEPKGG
jgi:hypothetical protein